ARRAGAGRLVRDADCVGAVLAGGADGRRAAGGASCGSASPAGAAAAAGARRALPGMRLRPARLARRPVPGVRRVAGWRGVMRKLLRILWNIGTAALVLLFAAAGWVWVRTQFGADFVQVLGGGASCLTSTHA